MALELNSSVWRRPPIRTLEDCELAFRSLELILSRVPIFDPALLGPLLTGDNEAYGSGWDGELEFPTKNATYDKIESVIAAATALISDAAYGSGWDGVTTIAPSKNAVYDEIQSLISGFGALLAALGLDSGTYTPTLTNVANLDAVTLGADFLYFRLGSIAAAAGYINVDPTVAATITQVGITLPVTSNIGAISDVIGLCAAAAVIGEAGSVFGDTANDRANVHFVCNSIANHSLFVIFLHKII